MSNHWTMNEWLSPSFSLIDSMFAGVATFPASRWAGSPPGILMKIR